MPQQRGKSIPAELIGEDKNALFGRKDLLLKENKQPDAYGNGGISNIEDRPEKNKIIATFKGHPFGEKAFIQGEIKHIYHVSAQEGGVACRAKFCQTGITDPVLKLFTVDHSLVEINP